MNGVAPVAETEATYGPNGMDSHISKLALQLLPLNMQPVRDQCPAPYMALFLEEAHQ